MNLLTDEEIDALWLPDGITKPQMIVRRAVVRAAEKAILAKLASAELPPLPAYECGPHTGHAAVRTDESIRAYGLQAHAQGFAAGAAAQLAEKPSAWKWTANKFHDRLEAYCPPDDAYDEGTLIELYTRREAK